MLTLVVCTLGRTTPLLRLLRSLQMQTDRRFRVVIVDQNPPGYLAGVLAEAGTLPITHIQSARGASRGRNAGLALVESELVAFPDDDCWYPPVLVAEVIARFGRMPRHDVIAGRTVDAQGRPSVSEYLGASGAMSRRDVFLAGNASSIFARTAVAKASGGFDETLGVGAGTIFGSGEETDFLLRCKRVGAAMHFDYDLVVHHDQVVRDLGKIQAYATGFGRVCRLHGLGTTFMAPRLLRAGVRSGALVASGQREEAKARWRWIAGAVRGYAARGGAEDHVPPAARST